MAVDCGRSRIGSASTTMFRPVRAGSGPLSCGQVGPSCPGIPTRRREQLGPKAVLTASGTLSSPKRVPDAEKAGDQGGLGGLVHTIEQLSTLEATLWSILEGLKSGVTYVSYFCREYWGTSASKAQLSLDKLDWNDRLKQQVQQACILESLSLAVTSSLSSGTMQDVSEATRSRLCSLLGHIHQNCLVLIDLVRQRWQPGSQSARADAGKDEAAMANLDFDILTRVERYRHLHRGEHVMALKQHNEVILNIVRQLCRGAARKPMLPKSRSSGSAGDLSPGSPGVGRGARGPVGNVMGAVNDVLASTSSLDRSRPLRVRKSMLQCLRFLPLLSDGSDADSPWPTVDPYERFGADAFANEGPVVWFEPLPPMMADLERRASLPPPPSPDAYTLVLDLDETLVHYYEINGVGNYGVRPGMLDFLHRMHSLGFELVIFTAATQDYADWVIGQIDPDGLIHHRLYRQHALPWGPLFAKDLSRLGRDLDRTVIIDNVQENFMKHPNNGIFICTWYDDPNDTALSELTPLLEELITTRARVPDLLEKYSDQIPLWAGFGQAWDCSGVGYDSQEGLLEEEGCPPSKAYAPSTEPAAPQPLDPGGVATDAHLQPCLPSHPQVASSHQGQGAFVHQACTSPAQAFTGPCSPKTEAQPMPQNVAQRWVAGPGRYSSTAMPIKQQATAHWAPAQQAPAQPAPVQQAPVPQAPVQQAPVPQAPVQQAPVQQAPVQQQPVQQAAMQQAPVQQASARTAWGSPFQARGISGSYQYVPQSQVQRHASAQHPHQQQQQRQQQQQQQHFMPQARC